MELARILSGRTTLPVRGRDSQRAKLYRAERAAKLDDRIMTTWECLVYAKSVMAWADANGVNHSRLPSHIRVATNNRTRGTCRRISGGWEIDLAPWAHCRWVVIHECCHALAPRDGAAHGWEFAAIYLKAVEQFLGKDSAKRLKDAFKKGRVRYRQPTSRPITPERRAALVAQLANARAARTQPRG